MKEKEVRKDLNGVPFALPSIRLSKLKYSKICSEISENYEKHQNLALSTHYSYNPKGEFCVYWFENRGFGDYNFYLKQKLKGGTKNGRTRKKTK